MIFNVLDYAAPQRAIAAAVGVPGGRVYFPAGTYRLDEPLVVPRFAPGPLAPAIELSGDGVAATTVYTNDPNVDLLMLSSSNVAVSKMLLQGAQVASGNGRGIVVSDAVNGSVLSRIHLSDLYVAAMPAEALYLPDGFPHLVSEPAYDRIAVACDYERVTFDSNLSAAANLVYIGRWNTTQRFTGCHFTNFKNRAMFLNGADTTSLRDCIIENGDNAAPWVEGVGAVATVLDHVYFEDHAFPSTAVFTRHDRASSGWREPGCTYRRRPA